MKNKFSLSFLCSLFLIFSFTSCVKKEYDAPDTANVDPDIAISKTIQEIQSMAFGTTPTEITTYEVIAGVVIADDASGNFYKEIIIEDASGGLSIPLDLTNFNTNYPIGRRIFVKCKGLYIADDGDGNFEIGVKDGTTIGRIPGALVGQYLTPGKWGIPVAPTVMGLSDLLSNPVPTLTLIQLNLVQFISADASQQYADPIGLMSLNRTIEDCSGNFVTLYNSGYADFAGVLTPAGKGSIVAVYKQYSGDAELLIRNIQDVNMNDPRCGSGGGGGTAVHQIDSLRMMYSGSDVTIASGSVITGIVISDYSTLNITANNMIVQDQTGGIAVRFTGPNTTFALHDSVRIDISGFTLTEFQGLLEVDDADFGSVTVLGTASVSPMMVTTGQVNAGLETYESRLVKIDNATLSGSGTYSGSVNITDASGTLIMYTRSGATFSGGSYPTGTVSVTGYITDFNGTPELIIRSTSDVQ